jgi:diguanylate cyclase (GGDEF)-like protein
MQMPGSGLLISLKYRGNTLPGILAGLLLCWWPAAGALAEEFLIESLESPQSIAGAWRFQVGDNMAWAEPGYDDLGWPEVLVPKDLGAQGYADYTGMAWYRFSVKFVPDDEQLRPDLDHLGVNIGKVHSAYELYAGGILLGGVGKLPPNPEMLFDRYRTFPIPRAAVDADGRVDLALRVWRHQERFGDTAAGAYEGPFLIGTDYDLTRFTGFSQMSLLVLSAIYLVFGVYHLYLYRRNPQLRQYLWFGLLTVLVGVYAASVSQWKHFLGMPFLVLKKVEFGVLYVMPALGMEMIWSMLGFRPPRWARLYQLSFGAWAAVAVLIPGYSIIFLTITPWQLCALPGLLAILAQVIWFSQGEPGPARSEARSVLVGTCVFMLTVANDILVVQGLLATPRLIPLGFAAILLSMAVSLANRFTLMFSDLEAAVRERTGELFEANVRLRKAARDDMLTGLLNRRGFIERADEEIIRARRSRRGFVLVMADIDCFKDFNDRYGHACGDSVLEQVGRLLRDQLRDVDVSGRWGGEEFILLLPETSLEGGVVLAEKLRASLAEHCFEYGDLALHLTVTFGVAEFAGEMSFDECLASADKALYAGKAAGRNVVMVEQVQE